MSEIGRRVFVSSGLSPSVPLHSKVFTLIPGQHMRQDL